MPRLLIALTLALLAAAPAAQAQAPQPNPLVYVFVLDGLDGDAVDEGNAPFIRQLVRNEQGARTTYFQESRSIMVAETNPNHVSMATGAYGDASGIPGNSFAVYGDTDGDTCPQATSTSNAPMTTSGETPGCLVAESFFESIQRSAQAGDLVTAGIFGKPKLGRIFAGKKADGSRYDADYLWTPCGPSSSEDYCKEGVPNRPNDAYALFDRDVMSEVIRTVDAGVPANGRSFDGGGRRPNLTFVNFPAIDSAGHGFGRGAEYNAAVTLADDEIERFVNHQKQAGLWERTVMILLSDHSMDSTPEKSTLRLKFEEAGIDSGDYKIVQNGSAALVYLTDRDDPNRFDLLRQLRAAALSGNPLLTGPPSVEALYRESNPDDGGDANTVAAVHPGWRLTGERVGDLVVTSRRGASFNDPVNPLAGNHGGPQTRDNFLAVAGGAPVINQRSIGGGQDDLFDDTLTNPDQSENVDVAPTVTRLLSQRAPAQSSGRFLAEAFNAALLPPAEPATAQGAPAAPAPAACATNSLFRSASARPAGRGLRFAFSRRSSQPVSVDVFQSSIGTRILGNRRIARFTRRTRSFTWKGRGARDGQLFARLRIAVPGGITDVRRVALSRRNGRFGTRPAFYRRASCGAVSSFKLERPVFGGRTNRALDASYRLGAEGRVTLELLRGSRVVRRLAPVRTQRADRTYRVRIASEKLRRGDHRVRLTVVRDGRRTVATLTAKRL